jgi:hypothetical protein
VFEVLGAESVKCDTLEGFAGETNKNQSFAVDETGDATHKLYRQVKEPEMTSAVESWARSHVWNGLFSVFSPAD